MRLLFWRKRAPREIVCICWKCINPIYIGDKVEWSYWPNGAGNRLAHKEHR